MLINGLAHTANTFQHFGQELFANPVNGVRIKRIITLDLPGRGGSGLPFGDQSVHFGDLNVDDFGEVLIGALDHHSCDNNSPSIVIGHSMGGLIIQTAQEHLASRGKTLRGKFGIEHALLLETAFPSAIVDPLLESGTGLYLIGLFTQNDPQKGSIVSIDSGNFLNLFFTTDLNGSFVPGTPSPAEVDSLGYKADESLAASIQTAGTSAMRVTVRTNAFAPCTGTRLHMIVGVHDVFNDVSSIQTLYEYLTGDSALSYLGIVDTPDAVHDQYITNPGAVLDALR